MTILEIIVDTLALKKHRNKVKSAGNEAKSKKLGVWMNPEYPWHWRKNHN